MTIREAALDVLNSNANLTVPAGRFLGQCVAKQKSLTEKQVIWLNRLRDKAGLSPFTAD